MERLKILPVGLELALQNKQDRFEDLLAVPPVVVRYAGDENFLKSL
jgi:hypothetical protein